MPADAFTAALPTPPAALKDALFVERENVHGALEKLAIKLRFAPAVKA